ncbi:MAG: hypothetical protein ACI9MB_000951 [Verrucomicrobiales bacterium]|jgi:hypothetical protein
MPVEDLPALIDSRPQFAPRIAQLHRLSVLVSLACAVMFSPPYLPRWRLLFP